MAILVMPFDSRKQQQWYNATDQEYLDDEPSSSRQVKEYDPSGEPDAMSKGDNKVADFFKLADDDEEREEVMKADKDYKNAFEYYEQGMSDEDALDEMDDEVDSIYDAISSDNMGSGGDIEDQYERGQTVADKEIQDDKLIRDGLRDAMFPDHLIDKYMRELL